MLKNIKETIGISFGVFEGGVGRGKFTINEATIDQLSATGLPVLDNSGKIVKNQFVNNETFGTGYSGGVFF